MKKIKEKFYGGKYFNHIAYKHGSNIQETEKYLNEFIEYTSALLWYMYARGLQFDKITENNGGILFEVSLPIRGEREPNIRIAIYNDDGCEYRCKTGQPYYATQIIVNNTNVYPKRIITMIKEKLKEMDERHYDEIIAYLFLSGLKLED